MRRFFLWYCPTLIVQLTGAWVTFSSVTTWYPNLLKPSWNPPNWVFAPVWTLLYILMAWSVTIVSLSPVSKTQKYSACYLFITQLFFNGMWSLLFFGLKSPGWALADLILLLGLLIATTLSFVKISKFAGLLMLPYLLWSLYALSLNVALVILNGGMR